MAVGGDSLQDGELPVDNKGLAAMCVANVACSEFNLPADNSPERAPSIVWQLICAPARQPSAAAVLLSPCSALRRQFLLDGFLSLSLPDRR